MGSMLAAIEKFLIWCWHEFPLRDLIVQVASEIAKKVERADAPLIAVGIAALGILMVVWQNRSRARTPAEIGSSHNVEVRQDTESATAEGGEYLESDPEWWAWRVVEHLALLTSDEEKAYLINVILKVCKAQEKALLTVGEHTLPPTPELVVLSAAQSTLVDLSSDFDQQCEISRERALELLQGLYKAARAVAVNYGMIDVMERIDAIPPNSRPRRRAAGQHDLR